LKTQETNLFILNENKLQGTDLRNYLKSKFGVSIDISLFSDGASCLERVNEETQIVILDYSFYDKDGLSTLKKIKNINPKTEVIMLSSSEDMATAIESFRIGAKDYVIKGKGSRKKISDLVRRILTEPLRMLVKEFRVRKYMAAFLLTFIGVGVAVYCVMQAMNW
jgi:DNA-binding NtrC family response regulator